MDDSKLKLSTNVSERIDIILNMSDDEDITDAIRQQWVVCRQFLVSEYTVLPTGYVRIKINDDVVMSKSKGRLGGMLRGLLQHIRNEVKNGS